MNNRIQIIGKTAAQFWARWFADRAVTSGEYKWHNYGESDALPLTLVQIVSKSGVAKRALGKFASYIEADGFANIANSKIVVNPDTGKTADALLSVTADEVAYFKAGAFVIKRNVDGTIRSVDNLPALYPLRKLETEGFIYDENIGRKKKDRTKVAVTYAPFRGQQASIEQMQSDLATFGNNGEILYFFKQSQENTIYGIPDYYAGISDLVTSNELQEFDLETVLNGFVASAILTLVGKVDSVNKDESGMTEADKLREDLDLFTGKIKDKEGRSLRNSLFVWFAENKELIPDLKSFDAKAIYDASTSKREFIERAVCRLFSIHPALLGYSEASVLGNDKAMQNAAAELNKVVNPLQRMITENMAKVLPQYDWTISSFKTSTENDTPISAAN